MIRPFKFVLQKGANKSGSSCATPACEFSEFMEEDEEPSKSPHSGRRGKFPPEIWLKSSSSSSLLSLQILKGPWPSS
jgi:hypothetical protein